MIVKQTLRIFHKFGRLIKPKISKVDNVFELMKDRTTQLNFIQKYNNKIYNINKKTTHEQILSQNLGISQKKSAQLTNTVIHSTAYSPIWMKPYRISQKLNNQIKVQDNTDQLQIPYNPKHTNLKFHYSINQDLPIIEDYKIDKSTSYIFSLPEDITEKQLTLELGYRVVKSVKIKHCMLGLPAYAIVQFNSENYLVEKFISNQLQINIGGRNCYITTEIDKNKLSLNRRQLVLKGLEQNQTPAKMLQKLSQYGRVVHLNFPLQICRQPSLKEIKEIYKNQKYPVSINYHRKNGTIQSEYYPPYEPQSVSGDFFQQKQRQYKRKLRYCQNINVYEGKQKSITTKSRGFCIATFSCQQQAQNCYLQLRNYIKMEVLNDRQQFEFDEKHRLALLRFIDNSYIQKGLQNPQKEFQESEKKLNSYFSQQLYESIVYQKHISSVYYNNNKIRYILKENQQNSVDLQLHKIYKQHLNELKDTVGKTNLNDSRNSNNLYGKSFDQLAQQELYGMKLKQKQNKQRYQVNIDDYTREQPIIKKVKTKSIKRTISFYDRLEDDGDGTIEPEILDQLQNQMDQQYQDEDAEPDQVKQLPQQIIQKQQKIQKPSKGKKNFSTMKQQFRQYRPKTLEQKVRSHMNYNRFVRDIINQYMGIFPTSKLQQQFFRKKATYINPQNLTFSDGTQFITEDQVKHVLQFSTNSAQQFYSSFIKQNQIVKSTNIDIEQTVLKNFDQNQQNSLQYYTDVGVVKQEFEYNGTEDINNVVRNLNKQALFGQEFRVVQDNQSQQQKIVKVAKLQNIYPLDVVQKHRKLVKNFENEQDYQPKKHEAIDKYFQYITNGKPIPDQMAQIFGLQKGTIINTQKLAQQLCQQFDMNKKDVQKLLNLSNYTQDQIGEDIGNQLKIGKARSKLQAKNASDFNKDPSQIKTKNKNKKSVVSKFRQI